MVSVCPVIAFPLISYVYGEGEMLPRPPAGWPPLSDGVGLWSGFYMLASLAVSWSLENTDSPKLLLFIYISLFLPYLGGYAVEISFHPFQ